MTTEPFRGCAPTLGCVLGNEVRGALVSGVATTGEQVHDRA